MMSRLVNSPMFHLVPQDCTDVTIRGIFIKSPADAPNTDGIDPSGWNYLITDCTIDGGDDNIAVKPANSRTPGNKNYTHHSLPIRARARHVHRLRHLRWD